MTATHLLHPSWVCHDCHSPRYTPAGSVMAATPPVTPLAGSVMTATHCYTPLDLSWLPLTTVTPLAGSGCCHSLSHPAGSVMTATHLTPQAGSVMTATTRYTPSWICHDCHL
ncbi:hypothetical protein Hamer_G026320 [Homarus americanus]|uniref:Uncharacterized protein n=1 Tax=Homarus americanus TaxID=6706 RepID=A0A8J5JJF3_HOMAM|nr:hypothetical protein Hamer_G026320 [Homarus americanus]